MENERSRYRQPWLHSGIVDGIFILAPPFIALALVVLFPGLFQRASAMPAIYWLILVVFVDVAHVYSTLYRTYFNAAPWRKSKILITIPVACYAAGVLLHATDALLFWRVLAYVAVFHFIRQQYGFMRLYSRKDRNSNYSRLLDTFAVYTATLYPLLYWHMSGDRQFNWFIAHDFFQLPFSALLLHIASALYGLILLLYLLKELVHAVNRQPFNWPRNLLIMGTFLSWYFGIVYFNGDMAFTMLNVVSHGIPYMALIWIIERKKQQQNGAGAKNFFHRTAQRPYGIISFLLVLIALAYLEEGFWDGFVWREHAGLFQAFRVLPEIRGSIVSSLLVPLLALPQATHYVLDGFIWKIRKEGSDL